MSAAPGPETIAVFGETWIEDRSERLDDRLLHDSVEHSWYAQEQISPGKHPHLLLALATFTQVPSEQGIGLRCTVPARPDIEA